MLNNLIVLLSAQTAEFVPRVRRVRRLPLLLVL